MDNGYLVMRDRARELRQEMTPEERRVWTALRCNRCGGLRFRRQKVFGQYIADFYCPAIRLVVEIDGSIHDTPEQRERDYWRDIALRENGLWVLRFRNAYVIRASTEQIQAALLERIEARQQPSAP